MNLTATSMLRRHTARYTLPSAPSATKARSAARRGTALLRRASLENDSSRSLADEEEEGSKPSVDSVLATVDDYFGDFRDYVAEACCVKLTKLVGRGTRRPRSNVHRLVSESYVASVLCAKYFILWV